MEDPEQVINRGWAKCPKQASGSIYYIMIMNVAESYFLQRVMQISIFPFVQTWIIKSKDDMNPHLKLCIFLPLQCVYDAISTGHDYSEFYIIETSDAQEYRHRGQVHLKVRKQPLSINDQLLYSHIYFQIPA